MTTDIRPETNPSEHIYTTLPIEKINGALLGAVVGDALGWPQEQSSNRQGPSRPNSAELGYIPWKRRIGGKFQSYEEDIKPGEYSDDTQMLLATTRSLLRGEQWAESLSKQELPLWNIYERGGGRRMKRAADLWLRRTAPWRVTDEKDRNDYFAAGGNGVAMRILPHVLTNTRDESKLKQDVVRNGILTHGHPRALVGALLYSKAAWWIAHTRAPLPYGAIVEALLDTRFDLEQPPFNGETSTVQWLEAGNHYFSEGYIPMWKKTAGEVTDGLQQIQKALKQGALSDDRQVLEQLGAFSRQVNGSATVTALSVIYTFAAHAADPEVGLRTLVFAKSADTDTLASMFGGLCGLTYGLDWLPASLRTVQDFQVVDKLASEINAKEYLPQQPVIESWTKQEEQHTFEELEGTKGNEVSLGVLGKSTVENREQLRPITRSLYVQRWKLRTLSGQTIYIKRVHKETVDERNLFSQQRNTPLVDSSKVEDFRSSSQSGRLLRSLAQLFPEDFPATNAFRMLEEILELDDPQSDKLSEIVKYHARSLSEKNQAALVKILDRYFSTMRRR